MGLRLYVEGCGNAHLLRLTRVQLEPTASGSKRKKAV
jgi:hypothetical protein